MKLNSSAILPAAGLLLLLSPTATDAFTIPTVLHITKARHPSRVQVAATHGVPVPVMMATAALDRAFDSRYVYRVSLQGTDVLRLFSHTHTLPPLRPKKQNPTGWAASRACWTR